MLPSQLSLGGTGWVAKTSEASAHTSWVGHADFFPLPRKAETTLQPVKAWYNVIPQLMQTCRLKGWHNTDCYDNDVCMTGFHVQICTALMGWMPAIYKYMCVCFLVTARGTPCRLIVWLLSAFSSLATITTPGDGICSILSARKLNISGLLSLSSKKLRQFEGPLHLLVTLRLAPCPRFDLDSALILGGRFTSNTMYVLSYLMEYARIVGRTSDVA